MDSEAPDAEVREEPQRTMYEGISSVDTETSELGRTSHEGNEAGPETSTS